jgi:hypothetical protein
MPPLNSLRISGVDKKALVTFINEYCVQEEYKRRVNAMNRLGATPPSMDSIHPPQAGFYPNPTKKMVEAVHKRWEDDADPVIPEERRPIFTKTNGLSRLKHIIASLNNQQALPAFRQSTIEAEAARREQQAEKRRRAQELEEEKRQARIRAERTEALWKKKCDEITAARREKLSKCEQLLSICSFELSQRFHHNQECNRIEELYRGVSELICSMTGENPNTTSDLMHEMDLARVELQNRLPLIRAIGRGYNWPWVLAIEATASVADDAAAQAQQPLCSSEPFLANDIATADRLRNSNRQKPRLESDFDESTKLKTNKTANARRQLHTIFSKIEKYFAELSTVEKVSRTRKAQYTELKSSYEGQAQKKQRFELQVSEPSGSTTTTAVSPMHDNLSYNYMTQIDECITKLEGLCTEALDSIKEVRPRGILMLFSPYADKGVDPEVMLYPADATTAAGGDSDALQTRLRNFSCRVFKAFFVPSKNALAAYKRDLRTDGRVQQGNSLS